MYHSSTNAARYSLRTSLSLYHCIILSHYVRMKLALMTSSLVEPYWELIKLKAIIYRSVISGIQLSALLA